MKAFAEAVQEWLDGESDVGDQAHLVAECRADPEKATYLLTEWRQETALRRLLRGQPGSLFARSVSAELTEARQTFARSVMRSVRHGRGSSSRRRRAQRARLAWWRPLAALAAVAAVLVLLRPWLMPPASPAGETLRVMELTGGGALRLADARAIRLGELVLIGEEVEVSADGGLGLVCADGSELFLASGSRAMLVDAAAGKTIRLAHGTLTAAVVPQAAGRPMRLQTAQSLCTVVGTRFRLEAQRAQTRLEVTQGRVRMQQVSDGAEAEITAGNLGIADAFAGLEVIRAESDGLIPVSPVAIWMAEHGTVQLDFGGPGATLPTGAFAADAGVFAPQRGYGWSEPVAWIPFPPDLGEAAQTRRAQSPPGCPLDRMPDRGVLGQAGSDAAEHLGIAYVGDAERRATWRLVVPNGRYQATVRIGVPWAASGPHQVEIEGVVAVNHERVPAAPVVERSVEVVVRDGELTMVIGGHGSRDRAPGETGATLIRTLVISRLP